MKNQPTYRQKQINSMVFYLKKRFNKEDLTEQLAYLEIRKLWSVSRRQDVDKAIEIFFTEIEDLTTSQIEGLINNIDERVGRVSNEEIKEYVDLKSELSYRQHFNA